MLSVACGQPTAAHANGSAAAVQRQCSSVQCSARSPWWWLWQMMEALRPSMEEANKISTADQATRRQTPIRMNRHPVLPA
jgi:hypothetical protein